MSKPVFIAVMWVALMATALSGPARAEENQRQISVTGQASVAAVPDMATINLGVTHQDKQAGAAMAATSASTVRILQRLGDLGVAPRDMQTSSLSLNPVWSNRNSSVSGNPQIIGFVASNTVLVRLRDLSELGRVLDAVIDDGANNFNGLRFSVQDPAPLMNLARQKAVADALARAQLLTTAAGVTLGPVLSMTEQGGARPVMMEMSAARAGGVPIAAGEVALNASVSMVFAITD